MLQCAKTTSLFGVVFLRKALIACEVSL